MPTDVAEHLARELGSPRVLSPSRDAERLHDYGQDESGLGSYPPACVALCDSAEQVSAVLRVAREHRVPVTPRGAGSGMTGGCLPVQGGIVLCTERMQRVVEIDGDDLVAVVEPGVITGELQSAVEAQGLFYPPDPASLAFCSIGGNAATNAGGPRAFKYGVTREYVLGLEVVLMGGERLRIGRRTAKGVTGYDLVAGFVGSEGTFGVITELTLKLLPRPADGRTLLAVFAGMHAAGGAIGALLGRGYRPAALELIDGASIEHIRNRSRYAFPRQAGAAVLIELDGEAESLDAALLTVGELCERAGALDVRVAQSASERRDLWAARRIISPSLREGHRHKISEDICVPRGAITEMLRRLDAISARARIPIATFGHAGDGNLHVNLLLDEPLEDPAVQGRVERTLHELFADTLALRGTLSGEHGIGLAKRRFMPMEQPEAVLEWQRRWKRMWDPLELLNPGKILPERRGGCSE
jgi:glycolate oxidase